MNSHSPLMINYTITKFATPYNSENSYIKGFGTFRFWVNSSYRNQQIHFGLWPVPRNPQSSDQRKIMIIGMTGYLPKCYAVSHNMKIPWSSIGSLCGLLIQSRSFLGGSGTLCRGRGLLSRQKTALVTDFPSCRCRGSDFGDEFCAQLVRTLFSWRRRCLLCQSSQVHVILSVLCPNDTPPSAARLRMLTPILGRHFACVLILVKTISILPNFPEVYQIPCSPFLANSSPPNY